MVFALGVPWLFGYFMLLAGSPTSKQAFAVIFSVLNSLQVTDKLMRKLELFVLVF